MVQAVGVEPTRFPTCPLITKLVKIVQNILYIVFCMYLYINIHYYELHNRIDFVVKIVVIFQNINYYIIYVYHFLLHHSLNKYKYY